jgi:twitching motility protein PilT
MDKNTIDALIRNMLQSGDGVSDLLFFCGKPPFVEINGKLHAFSIDARSSPVTAELIDSLADHITEKSDRLMAQFETRGSCDCSYAIDDIARFRVNIFKQNGGRAVVMRKLQPDVPTIEGLGLSPICHQIVKEKNGIILVTGACGSGKTTTLAAMINQLNQTEDIHILTLEDPIEFVHPHARAAVSHRELGRDFPSFAEGLRSALRQAPKVILVGEIRDRETMEIAMAAAETGHLVFSTLHTINASQSINRIIGFFSRDEESQMRDRFADTLRYIVSQRLVHAKMGGRLLITEIMGSNLRTRETIRYGESEHRNLQEIVHASTNLGWQTFDQSLLQAREADLVTDEVALMYCNNKPLVARELDLLAKRRGLHSETASGLKLDRPLPIIINPSTGFPVVDPSTGLPLVMDETKRNSKSPI